MADRDWRWPTSEEWEAVLSLSKNGDIKPIINLLRAQAPNVHRAIYDTLEELDHWDNSTKWIISKTPKGSVPKRKTAGRPARKDKDFLYLDKLKRLAKKIGQIQLSYIEDKKRLPRKTELHAEIDADETLSLYLGFRNKKRTARNRMITEAHQLLMAVNKE
ncbi:hypothetical protein N8Z70_02380 [Candidatus Puniceispirillum sp.]|nr:hypothetical protein [Alphaproteobacteria bacterium]MDC1293874.1 hypothetical protein [Candidatus Puniceispirillum sp.]